MNMFLTIRLAIPGCLLTLAAQPEWAQWGGPNRNFSGDGYGPGPLDFHPRDARRRLCARI